MRLLPYTLLMLLFAPLLVLGFPFYFVPILLRRGKVSGTAYEPFNARLIYHLLGARPDAAAAQLARVLPATNAGCRFLLFKPLLWATRLSGHTPAYMRYPPPRPVPMSAMVGLRCEFIDGALLRCRSEVQQVVILGAGFDTRAYGLLAGREVKVFEVDAPNTQAAKLAAIRKVGIDASHVTFVSCDFNETTWLDALVEHGFDPAVRTFLVWEGVTMYLEEHAIKSTLRAVATLPAGSRIACDFFTREWMEDTFAGKMARRSVKLTYGEPFTFGFPAMPDFSGRLSEYLAEYGLTLEHAVSFGARGEGRAPYGGLLLARSPASGPG